MRGFGAHQGATPNAARAERRMAPRFVRTVAIGISNGEERWRARTIDVSLTGALIQIEDERFAGPEVLHNFVRFGMHASRCFSAGIELYLPDIEEPLPAEFVRVKRDQSRLGERMLLACRFSVALDEEHVRALKLDDDQPVIPPPLERPMDRPLDRQEPAVPVQAVSQLPLGAMQGPEQETPPLPEPEPLPVRRAASGPEPESIPEGEPASASDRRDSRRHEQVRYVEVRGETGCFKARALDFSSGGVLISLTDAEFAPPSAHDQVVNFTRRLGEEFGGGMTVRFPDSGIELPAEVVRLTERLEEQQVQVVIGCHFRRELTFDECERLGIEPPVPAETPVVPGPHGRTRGHGTRLRALLRHAANVGASDVHVKVGVPPRLRVVGTLVSSGLDPVSAAEADAMARELMDDAQVERFEHTGDVELVRLLAGIGRFRVNVLRQRGQVSLAVRCMPAAVPTLAALGLPDAVRAFAEEEEGLVLVTGPTGSGKSTTLAALVDHINHNRACHVLTLESPIEFVHEDDVAHVTQREVGPDVPSFTSALERAMRQDPDVILVAEMSDLATLSLALTAAETGRLVLGTLPTPSAVPVPDRVVDVFPPAQQNRVRRQLACCLRGVVAQALVPRDGSGEGVVLAQEILTADDGVRACIANGRTKGIAERLAQGGPGQRSFEAALAELVDRGEISALTAQAQLRRARSRGGVPL